MTPFSQQWSLYKTQGDSAEHWRVQKLGERPEHKWDEAAVKWLQETAYKRTHHEDVPKLDWLRQFLGNHALSEITRDEIAGGGMQEGRVEQRNSEPSPCSGACDFAQSVSGVGVDRPGAESEDVPGAKTPCRWITPKRAQGLLAALPEHQRDIALFALATGLRQSNVVRLRWSQVDLDRRTAWIAADEAKGGEDIHVSLCDLAVEVLARQRGKHAERVFTYQRNPIRYVNTKAWRNALKRASIMDFRWHDLRHTWASWLIQNGTPLYDLQEIGGWKSAAMVRRYAHLAPHTWRVTPP